MAVSYIHCHLQDLLRNFSDLPQTTKLGFIGNLIEIDWSLLEPYPSMSKLRKDGHSSE
uniref:Uncharacterized protein n=1 Tax=Rhodnius prolixus TaxID=13249 RepID=A0A905QW85_RHOPR